MVTLRPRGAGNASQKGGNAVSSGTRAISKTPEQVMDPAATAVLHGAHTHDRDVTMRLLVDGYAADPYFSNTIHTSALVKQSELWYRNECLVVPAVGSLRQKIIQELHSTSLVAHNGVDKTTELVLRFYWWAGIREDIRKFIALCDPCQRNKSRSKQPAGKLNPLPIPEDKFTCYSMDHIVRLPESKLNEDDPAGFDAVLVVVDRLSKMTTLIPTYTTATVEQHARDFFRFVVSRFGVPKDIVSDRGPIFTSKFQRELNPLYGIHGSYSTAYHPQSDGQTERPRQWVAVAPPIGRALPAAEFAINNSFRSSIGTTPFRLAYGKDPRMPLSTVPVVDIWCASVAKFRNDWQEAISRQDCTCRQRNPVQKPTMTQAVAGWLGMRATLEGLNAGGFGLALQAFSRSGRRRQS
eukprot:365817-Chlamydomonas_euryale.AAC.37